jgi:hypothetical protein
VTKNVFIIHHLGLGDHILCNGLVRELIVKEKLDKIFYPVKIHNIDNINRMYCDIKNIISLVPVRNDKEMIEISKKFHNSEIINIGMFSGKIQDITRDFSYGFYDNCKIDFSKRWDSFYLEKKTMSNEKEIILGYKKEKVFVHEDTIRGYKINNKYLLNKEIYRPNHTLGRNNGLTLFDYYDILTKVNEIHCIDSSFACFIDHLPELRDKEKFIHRYARLEGGPEYKNNWHILHE